MSEVFWNRAAFAYDLFVMTTNGKVNREMTEITSELVSGSDRILDAAAGTGLNSIAAAPLVGEIVCADISTEMLRTINAKAKRLGIDNIRFKTCDILDLPFKDESFDCAVAANVIHLLDEPQKALSELFRVTKCGGRVIVPTYLVKKRLMSRLVIGFCKAVGFRSDELDPDSFKKLVGSTVYGEPEISVIDGNIPLGIAVFIKS